jgi:hypothetical protein
MILTFFFTAIFFVELIFAIKEVLPKAIIMIRDRIRKARHAKRSSKKTNSIYPVSEYTLNTQQNEEGKPSAQINPDGSVRQYQNGQPNRRSEEAAVHIKELDENMVIEDLLGEKDSDSYKKS